jgi:glutathione S-transferase
MTIDKIHQAPFFFVYVIRLGLLRYDTALNKPNKKIDRLDQILSDQDFLLGGEFTVAVVAVASYLLYVPQFFRGIDLSRWPNVVRYMKTCASRENYAKAFSAELSAYLCETLESMDGKSNKLFGMF